MNSYKETRTSLLSILTSPGWVLIYPFCKIKLTCKAKNDNSFKKWDYEANIYKVLPTCCPNEIWTKMIQINMPKCVSTSICQKSQPPQQSVGNWGMLGAGEVIFSRKEHTNLSSAKNRPWKHLYSNRILI